MAIVSHLISSIVRSEDMADFGHLERMGRELKCPICLSLVSSAVSLGCNHVFCKSCILSSMKATSSCPVCKVPFRRREVRPAPHMDNLVSIYKHMEIAAGVNIHTTQKEPLINSSVLETRHVCGDDQSDPCVKKSKNSNKSCRKKSKKKPICKSNEEKLNTCSVEDFGSQKSTYSSLTANKRVRMPSYPISETPLGPQNVLKSHGPNICHNTIGEESTLQNKKNGSATLKEAVSLNEKNGHLFAPFFSLRENEAADSEDMVELSSQQIADDCISDNFVPCFSDLKDSDSRTPEKPTHVQSKQCHAPVFDSEMVACTQKECSPELFSTPIHQRVFFQSNNIESNVQENSGAKKLPSLKCQNKTVVTHAGGTRKNKKGFSRSLQKCTSFFADNSTTDANDEISILLGGDMLKAKKENHSKEKTLQPFEIHMLKSNIENHHEEMSLLGSLCRESKNSESMEFAVRKRKRAVESSTSLKNVLVYTSKRKNRIKKNSDGCFSEDAADEIVVDCQQNTENNLPIISNESVQNFDDEKQHLHAKCSTLSTQIKCAFCKSFEETEVSGVMMHYFNGKPVAFNYNGGINVVHSHRHCTEWAPNVYFKDETALNLSDELARSRRISCSSCGIKGAALGCFEKSCRKSFHFTCAKLVEDCRWDTANFVMLCSLHSTCKLPCEVATPMTKKRKNPKRESQNLAISKPNDSTCNLWKWPHCAPYKWVFCCSALNDSEKEMLVAFTKVTGVQVSKSWNPSITHVIASTDENGACKRTLKVLMGILEGRWILRIDWLKSCLSNKGPVDEDKFEVSVDNHGIKDGPLLGRLRVGSKKPKLFCGSNFYFMGDFTPAYKGYLQELVNAAGGTVLQRKPIAKESIFDHTDKSGETYIIYGREKSENHKSKNDKEIFIQKQMEAESVADTCGAKCASNTWFLDSIASCTLQSL